jgi:hypothetical protein
MKKTILYMLLSLSPLFVFTQINGVEKLNITGVNYPSFMLLDRNDNLWIGESRHPMSASPTVGLKRFKNNAITTIYQSVNFASALEVGNNVYFTSSGGLHTYDGSNFTVNNSMSNGSGIVFHNNKLFVGRYTQGLYEQTTNGFEKVAIVIDGKSIDSINCLASSGNELLIGTNDGLVIHDGSSYKKYPLPSFHKAVISVNKDKDGRVWVLNNNAEFNKQYECLYIFQDGKFTSARDYYKEKNECVRENMIGYSHGKNLFLSKTGNVILAADWGLLEFEKDEIVPFIPQSLTAHYFNSNLNNRICYCDKDGNYYMNNQNGWFKVNPQNYSIEEHNYSPFINHNTIDINEVTTNVGNTGIHLDFVKYKIPQKNLPSFNIPETGCVSPVFAAALWMGGKENISDDLHTAAESYRQTGIDFKPGPIDLMTKTFDSLSASPYNKVWKVSKQTIEDFKTNRNNSGYVIPKEIMDWPAHGTGNFSNNLAPFVDTDNNGIYEPQKGDYPKIKGDQMLWWVFNDLGTHTETGGNPLGVEIHGSCYAYYYIDLPTTDSNAIVNRTIIFNYKIINRSDNDYKDYYVGIWNDFDLGAYYDDYVGCDTVNNASFVYNGKNYDSEYGQNPPLFFCKFLNQKMSGFIMYNNDFNPINGNPSDPGSNPNNYYSYLQSKWKNGQQLTHGGNGLDTLNAPTTYMFPGKICNDPGWTEPNAGIVAGDRRALMSAYSPLLQKDSAFELEFAYILLYDPQVDFLTEQCDRPGETLKKIQNWYDNDNFPSRPYYGVNTALIEQNQLELKIYPNPANTFVNLNTNVNSDEVYSVQVYSNSGMMVYQSTPEKTNNTFNTTINISHYASGLYFVKINTVKGTASKILIKD